LKDYLNSKIVRDLVGTKIWSAKSAFLGERAGFKCEYCGRDLSASVNDYKDWQEDHIVPKSKGGDNDDVNNLAVSCRPCNVNWKAKWDPSTVCGDNASREELIEAVRKHVAQRKTKAMKDLITFRNIVYAKS
jgi:5-methylcytosine-specific restriction endonuclease McrA